MAVNSKTNKETQKFGFRNLLLTFNDNSTLNMFLLILFESCDLLY